MLGKIAKAKTRKSRDLPCFSEITGRMGGLSTSKAGIEVWQKDVLDFINAAF